MAEHDRDDYLSRRYRELAREEPPRALDDAILAAARREVEARPAPLVAPTGRRRWFVPVAAAAVIVLSAVVTLHVQREQPDPELAAPQMTQAPAARKDEAPAVAPRPEMREEKLAAPAKDIDALRAQVEAPQVQAERRRAPQGVAPRAAKPAQAPAGESAALARPPAEPKPPAEQERFSPDPGPAVAAAPAPPPASPPPQMQMRQAAPAPQPAPRAADSTSSAGAAPPAAAEDRGALGGLRDNRMLAKREAAPETPEQMLERIAPFRREGRGREADDLYTEFKRRFPDYRIPDALREQVVPR